MHLHQRRRRDRVRDVRRVARQRTGERSRPKGLRPLHARERSRRERVRGVRRVVVPAVHVHALRARGRRVLRRL